MQFGKHSSRHLGHAFQDGNFVVICKVCEESCQSVNRASLEVQLFKARAAIDTREDAACSAAQKHFLSDLDDAIAQTHKNTRLRHLTNQRCREIKRGSVNGHAK